MGKYSDLYNMKIRELGLSIKLGFFHNYPKIEAKRQIYPKFCKFTCLPLCPILFTRLPHSCQNAKTCFASSLNYNLNAISSTLSAHSPSITPQEIKTDFFLQKSTKQTQLYLPSHSTIITNLLFKLNKHNLFLLKKMK